MGKGRNRNKDKDPYAGPTHPRGHRDDESDSDESVSTHLTFDDDMRSVQGDIENIDDVIDKLSEHLDNAQHKNIGIRLAALQGLQLALTSEYVPDFICRNKVTLVDMLSKNVHNKTDAEVVVSATLLALISIQVGGEISEEIEPCLSSMRTVVMDASKIDAVRIACALSLAITTRLSCEIDESVTASIKACRHAWSSVKPTSSGHARLFSMTLSSWCLLLLDADGNTLSSSTSDQPKIVGYLSAEQLDMRIAAGEALAFLHEHMKAVRPGFRFPNENQVFEILEELIGESTKSKAKRDKRVQRFTLREVYGFMRHNEETPVVTIKFGQESLSLDTCSIKLFYDLSCEVLRGGMMRQLQQNEALREVFDLGPVPLEAAERDNKSMRMAVHGAADKYRNQVRGRQREKRSAVW